MFVIVMMIGGIIMNLISIKGEKTKENRNSNFELMRIFSMFLIIIYHIILRISSTHSYEMSPFMYMFLKLIIAITIVHVNSFIILTGYFQCKKQVKFSKFISINNAVWFYEVTFLLIAIFLTFKLDVFLAYPITKLDVFKTLIPLDYGIYWYIGCYLILYLISPILNKVINNCDKKGLLKIILLLLLILSIVPTLTLDNVVYTNQGHSVANFVLLYFVGAYLRNYPIEESIILKKFSNTALKTLYFILFFYFSMLSILCFSMSEQLSNPNGGEILKHISDIFFNFYNSFGSPIIIIQTIVYFLFFSKLNIQSKFVNFISKYTLGVYLIHENIYVRDNLYSMLNYFNVSRFRIKQLLLIFITAFLIYIFCTLIEIIRQFIFKFIYNRKLSCRFRNFCKGFLYQIGFNINW